MRRNSHITAKVHIRKGDLVKVLSGNYKYKQGKVLQVFPEAYKAIVADINMVSRHIKPSTKNPQGGIERREAPLHISKLMVIDPATGEATRVGRKLNEAGNLERYSKKTGKFIKNG